MFNSEIIMKLTVVVAHLFKCVDHNFPKDLSTHCILYSEWPNLALKKLEISTNTTSTIEQESESEFL